MRKILLSIVFSLFFLTLSVNVAFAENTFDCKWSGGKCIPRTNTDCVEGYDADYTYCFNITDKDTCKSSTGISCIEPSSDAGDQYAWCDAEKTRINTAIGCIPVLGTTGRYDFLNFVIKWAVGLGGGIAFILIVYSGFMTMTAQGNPERLQAGKELLTSAITGLILLIFSVFILKFIGIDILGLCKFGFGSCPT